MLFQHSLVTKWESACQGPAFIGLRLPAAGRAWVSAWNRMLRVLRTQCLEDPRAVMAPHRETSVNLAAAQGNGASSTDW